MCRCRRGTDTGQHQGAQRDRFDVAFGEAGIEAEGHVAQRVGIGGSLTAGWASSAFNDAYADIAKSALDRMSVEGWLTAHGKSHFYIGPHFEFSTIVD